MGRYATIQSSFQEDTEVSCSGILAQAIREVIGEKDFEEWVITLNAYQVVQVMMEMVKIMSINIGLDYQKIKERETGYRKLSLLMLWHRDCVIPATLTFC